LGFFGVVCGVIRGWSAAYLFAIHLDVGHIILEHGGHIDLGELIFAEDNQKASFTAGTVADNYQFLANRRHWKFCKRQSRNCTRMQSDAVESRSPIPIQIPIPRFAVQFCLIYSRKLSELFKNYQNEKATHMHSTAHTHSHAPARSLFR